MKRRIWVAAFAPLVLLACATATSPAPGEPNVRPFCVQRPGDAEAICYVSFVQLLAHPERFHGKQVQVIGYMSQIHASPHVAVELFLLAPDAPPLFGQHELIAD